MSRIALVLAMADNGVIGAHGAIPWRLPEDMRRFKAITMGKPIVMGRKTWDSLPRNPLPGRSNIVITRDRAFRAQGAAVVHSLDEALTRAQREQPDEIMIVGGAEIYLAALPRADVVHLTQVHGDFEGDAHMPPFDRKIWRETTREDHATPEGLRYSYVTLEKALPSP
jgi:dihydrofolate reductase